MVNNSSLLKSFVYYKFTILLSPTNWLYIPISYKGTIDWFYVLYRYHQTLALIHEHDENRLLDNWFFWLPEFAGLSGQIFFLIFQPVATPNKSTAIEKYSAQPKECPGSDEVDPLLFFPFFPAGSRCNSCWRCLAGAGYFGRSWWSVFCCCGIGSINWTSRDRQDDQWHHHCNRQGTDHCHFGLR